MTYGKHDAFSDAYGDALNDFIDEIDGLARSLVLQYCDGQYRDDVAEILSRPVHDDFGKQFIQSAIIKMNLDAKEKKS